MSVVTPFLISALLNQGLPPSQTDEAQVAIRSGASSANATHVFFRGPSINFSETYGIYMSHEIFYQSQIQNSYIQTPGFISGEILFGRKTSPWGVTKLEDILASERIGYFEMGFHLDKALSKTFYGYQNPYRFSFMVRTGAETLSAKSFHSHIWAKFPIGYESSTFGGEMKYIFSLAQSDDWTLAPDLSVTYALNPKLHEQDKQKLYVDPKIAMYFGPEIAWKKLASFKIRMPYLAVTDGKNISRQYWLAWKYPEFTISLQTKF